MWDFSWFMCHNKNSLSRCPSVPLSLCICVYTHAHTQRCLHHSSYQWCYLSLMCSCWQVFWTSFLYMSDLQKTQGTCAQHKGVISMAMCSLNPRIACPYMWDYRTAVSGPITTVSLNPGLNLHKSVSCSFPLRRTDVMYRCCPSPPYLLPPTTPGLTAILQLVYICLAIIYLRFDELEAGQVRPHQPQWNCIHFSWFIYSSSDELRALCMPGKHSVSKLHLHPYLYCYWIDLFVRVRTHTVYKLYINT